MLWLWSVDEQGHGHVQVLDTPGFDVTVDREMWQSAPFVQIDGEPAGSAVTLLLGKYHVPDTTGYSGELPPDGAYRYTASAADLEAAGATPSYAATESGGGTFVLDLETPNGLHRCDGTATSLDGKAVRIDTTSPTGPHWCSVDFDIAWHMDGDTFWYALVGAENLADWSVPDWDNEQAWSQIPHLRID